MTANDPMPFGKHKGTPINKIPKDYQAWMCKQTGFEDNHPELFAIFSGKSPAEPEESELDAQEDLIMSSAPEGFSDWWWEQYGKNLRRQKSPQHIAFLNVALTAWKAALKTKPIPQPPVKPKPNNEPLDENVPF